MQRIVQKLYLSKLIGSDRMNKTKFRHTTYVYFFKWQKWKRSENGPAWQRYNVSMVTCTQAHCLQWTGRVWQLKLLLSPLLARVWCLHQIWSRPSTTENTFQHVSDWSCLLWWRTCLSCLLTMNSTKIQLHSSALKKVQSELFFSTKMTYIWVLRKWNKTTEFQRCLCYKAAVC